MAKALHHACESGMVQGSVGSLDFNHASIDELDRIIAAYPAVHAFPRHHPEF